MSSILPPTPGEETTPSVELILGYVEGEPLSLDIPLKIIRQNTVRPMKYLTFCATYITGVRGHISLLAGGDPPPDGTQVAAEQHWYWVPFGGQQPFGNFAINMHAGPEGRNLNDTYVERITPRSRQLKKKLLPRDECCVFTALEEVYTEGMHIIPPRVGNDLLHAIFSSRKSLGDDDLPGLVDPDDPAPSLLMIHGMVSLSTPISTSGLT